MFTHVACSTRFLVLFHCRIVFYYMRMTLFSHSLCIHSPVEHLDCFQCCIIMNTAKQFSKMVVLVYPPSDSENSVCSTSLPTPDLVSLQNFSDSNRCVVISHGFIFVKTENVENVSICFLAIWLFFFVKCLFRVFLPFSKWVVCLFLSDLQFFTYSVYVSFLFQTPSSSLWLAFYFLIGFFDQQKLLNFTEIYLTYH